MINTFSVVINMFYVLLFVSDTTWVHLGFCLCYLFLRQDLIMWRWLDWWLLFRSEWSRTNKSNCLCLPRAGTKDVYHHSGHLCCYNLQCILNDDDILCRVTSELGHMISIIKKSELAEKPSQEQFLEHVASVFRSHRNGVVNWLSNLSSMNLFWIQYLKG